METPNFPPRLAREWETVQRMSYLYCHEQHGAMKGTLCPECAELMHYALDRLRRCPFQETKSTCAKCTVHCYKPAMRQKVRQMMRYAGPQMLVHHPILTVRHLIDGISKPPALDKKKNR